MLRPLIEDARRLVEGQGIRALAVHVLLRHLGNNSEARMALMGTLKTEMDVVLKALPEPTPPPPPIKKGKRWIQPDPGPDDIVPEYQMTETQLFDEAFAKLLYKRESPLGRAATEGDFQEQYQRFFLGELSKALRVDFKLEAGAASKEPVRGDDRALFDALTKTLGADTANASATAGPRGTVIYDGDATWTYYESDAVSIVLSNPNIGNVARQMIDARTKVFRDRWAAQQPK